MCQTSSRAITLLQIFVKPYLICGAKNTLEQRSTAQRGAAKYGLVILPWTKLNTLEQRSAAKYSLEEYFAGSNNATRLQPIQIGQGNNYEVITRYYLAKY